MSRRGIFDGLGVGTAHGVLTEAFAAYSKSPSEFSSVGDAALQLGLVDRALKESPIQVPDEPLDDIESSYDAERLPVNPLEAIQDQFRRAVVVAADQGLSVEEFAGRMLSEGPACISQAFEAGNYFAFREVEGD